MKLYLALVTLIATPTSMATTCQFDEIHYSCKTVENAKRDGFCWRGEHKQKPDEAQIRQICQLDGIVVKKGKNQASPRP